MRKKMEILRRLGFTEILLHNWQIEHMLCVVGAGFPRPLTVYFDGSGDPTPTLMGTNVIKSSHASERTNFHRH